MEADYYTFLQILRVKNCEIWQGKGNHTMMKAKGAVQVLYSTVLDLFVLRLSDFKFALDKSLQVIAMRDEKDKHFFSYMLPTFDGFYMFKVFNASLEKELALTNFETILENCCHFMRRSGLEQKLENLRSFHEEKEEPGILEKVGESIYEGLIKTDYILGPAILSEENEMHPNQRIVRSFDELKDVESSGVPVIDIPKEEIQNMIDESKEVSRMQQWLCQTRELLPLIWKDKTNIELGGTQKVQKGASSKKPKNVPVGKENVGGGYVV